MKIKNFSDAALAELHADVWTEPYWQAAREHRLVVAKCTTCGHVRMPPGPYCPRCRAQEVDWWEVTGRGTVFAFTVVRHAVISSIKELLPYVIAVIELTDAPGVRLIANLWDVTTDEVAIGLDVDVIWDDVSAAVSIPRFGPARTAAS